MKKLILALISLVAINQINAQSGVFLRPKPEFKKERQKAKDQIYRFEIEKSVDDTIIYISNSIKDTRVSDELNLQAYLTGETINFDSIEEYKYNNLDRYRETKYKQISFSPNTEVNQARGLVVNSNKTRAWPEMIFTFLYFLVFSFLIIRKNFNLKIWVLALLPLLLSVIVPVELKSTAIMTVGFVLLLSLYPIGLAIINVSQDKLKVFKIIWFVINVIGMSIVAYFYTPLFLICTLLGMLMGYIFYVLYEYRIIYDDADEEFFYEHL